MLFRSVKNWLTVLILALVALAMVVAWVYVVPPLLGRLDKQKLLDERGNAKIISETVSDWVTFDPESGQTVITDRASLETIVRRLSLQLGARVVVLTRDKAKKYDSGEGGFEEFFVGDYPIVEEALASGEVVQAVVTTGDGRFAATAVPLFAEGGTDTVSAVVLTIASLADVDKAVDAVQGQLFFALVLALGVSLVLGYLVSFFIARRLKRIELSAEAIATGDLTAKVPDAHEDEIGQLAGAFNTMAERLRNAFAQVENERDRVEVLLNDLSEGVIGLSSEGKITIANPAAGELLGGPSVLGSDLDKAFPVDVAEAWRESRRHGTVEATVFVHGDRTLEATTYPVGSGADFTSIIVLRDVTARARLDRARRDLIANASHEFKTPLFSLAGSLELIDEGGLSPEEQRDFLQIMRQQIDRLSNLAVSMLDLSRVEAGSFELHYEEVELAAVARSVLDEFQAQGQASGVALVLEGGQGDTAWSDEQRLAQILRALVDNAVKFSPPGSTVRVTAAADAETATLVVRDNGPGIPDGELPHVFERFHRGRQERASTSGAGLGLSIARELTELLGGQISAASRDGEGATFTVRLPREAQRRGASPS